MIGRELIMKSMPIPPRVEYLLTEMVKSLIPVLNTMIDWSLVHFEEVTK